MRKSFFLLILGLLLSYSATAQMKFKAGYLYNNLTVSTQMIPGSDNSTGHGFFAGFSYEIPAAKNLTFEPGLNFDWVNFDISDDYNIYFLKAPLHLNYNIEVSNVATIIAGVGPSLVIGLDGKYNPFGDDGLERFDLQLGLNVGVRIFEKFEIKAGYDWGLINMSDEDEFRMKRDGINVGLAYIF